MSFSICAYIVEGQVWMQTQVQVALMQSHQGAMVPTGTSFCPCWSRGASTLAYRVFDFASASHTFCHALCLGLTDE
jgi:hypothetical protein